MNDKPGDPASEAPDAGGMSIDGLPLHDWPARAEAREPMFQVVYRQSVLNAIYEHAAGSPQNEVCGVMVGSVVRDARGPFVHVRGSIRGEHAENQVAEVTFTAETWTHIEREMDARYAGERIVGWYHTHPNFGIFLSEMDLFIHRNFFDLPWQLAHVVDPVREEEGVFVWRHGTPTVGQYCVEPDATPAREMAAPGQRPYLRAGSGIRVDLEDDVAALRARVRSLSVGVIAAMVIALGWPILLLYMSMPEEPQAGQPAPRRSGEFSQRREVPGDRPARAGTPGQIQAVGTPPVQGQPQAGPPDKAASPAAAADGAPDVTPQVPAVPGQEGPNGP